MRIERRGREVLQHDHDADPRNKPAAEQRKMRDPHRDQNCGAEESQLDRDCKNLIVRIDRLHACDTFAEGDAVELLRD